MLRKLYLLIPILGISFMTSCNDDDDDNDVPETGSCPPGTDFCMNYGGEQKSGLAELSEAPGTNPRVIITWEDAVNGQEEVEMSIYGNAPGDYVVDTSRVSGTVYFEYYNSNLNERNHGTSGTVNISTFDPGQQEVGLTGSFELTMDDGTQVTDGHFLQVDKP